MHCIFFTFVLLCRAVYFFPYIFLLLLGGAELHIICVLDAGNMNMDKSYACLNTMGKEGDKATLADNIVAIGTYNFCRGRNGIFVLKSNLAIITTSSSASCST